MPILFEFGETMPVSQPSLLKDFLHAVWQNRFSIYPEMVGDDEDSEEEQITKCYQPFLNFDGNYIRARNYIGFIQQDDLHIEIYPKVFKGRNLSNNLMLSHIFFWLNYCRKWKLPFNKVSLDNLVHFNLPELIMFLMASRIHEVVSSRPVSMYLHTEERSSSPKGRINFPKYLALGFATGNFHLIDYEYEPFVFDNRLNRAIKYTTRLLLSRTTLPETQSLLEDLVFILDDVEDIPCTASDIEQVKVNPLFAEYNEVKDICTIVIKQQIYSNNQFELAQWCLLLPMEYIFEDFVAGFIETHFSKDWKVEYQKSNVNLVTLPYKVFRMKHDIFLTNRQCPKHKIIIDTKYKLRHLEFKKDPKKGISQDDLYQVTSYALRRGCKVSVLLFPNTQESLADPDFFVIEQGFENHQEITIVSAEIPFLSEVNFERLSENLEKKLSELLKNISF